LGTIIGTWFSSTYLFVACLAMAAGALLYVIGELLPIGRRLSRELTLWGLLPGSGSGWPANSSWMWPAAKPTGPPVPERTRRSCRSTPPSGGRTAVDDVAGGGNARSSRAGIEQPPLCQCLWVRPKDEGGPHG
jgi:hypothetical protein